MSRKFDYSALPLLAGEAPEAPELPNYVKIYDIIYTFIAEGNMKAGEAVPSENALASYWNVSRGTVRMAMRKLEEDGYIHKTQGKQAVVAANAVQTKSGVQWLYNPCLENCISDIDSITSYPQYQPCGVYVAHELGYEEAGQLMVAVGVNYFSGKLQTANSFFIFNASYLEEFSLDMNRREMIQEFVIDTLYQLAKKSKTEFNVSDAADSYIADVQKNTPLFVFEEILIGEEDKPLAYAKHQLLGSHYRFTLERKSHL